MDYDLSRLSTRSFEQLVQALALAVISPGVSIFGDGRDGGREASFDGRVPFPSPAAPWEGYGIVQAKFRQCPLGGGKDADWALTELKGELAKLSNPGRRGRSPEYYLFATNVVLTPVAESGGKDRVAALLDDHCAKHGMKDYRIWDQDQICALLDSQTSIRTAYAAWVTPGDVLSAVLARMPHQAEFRSVMRSFVQKELRADQYVNLGQAGHQESERTALARVFVDLPLGSKPQAQAPRSPDPTLFEPDGLAPDADGQGDSGTMPYLHVLAAQRLNPSSNPPRGGRAEPTEEGQVQPGRVVLIGGPGQGKSTLSQFLCQAHRAALLGLEPDKPLPPEIRDALDQIRRQCAAESLDLPSVPRFPLRVVLNAFAKELADGKTTSLFDYLRSRIAALTERDLARDDLHAWLGLYPWLLVLDGLDEVPGSSNRGQVLESIQNFLLDAHDADADLLLVATSRPQGYNDDFSPRYYRHAYLLPLDVPRALHYAGRLAGERWGSDRDRVDRVLGRLRRAGTEPATARLMQSPLQVAIMTLLVDNTGEPPRERWRLFSDYYRVIYDRERQRDIPAARLLADYQAEIDTIHQRIAVRLQAASEQAGGTDATLDEAAFSRLVDERLAEEGHPEADRADLTRRIREAALLRLVFLVAPKDGAIGFEVRSLQEFMAGQFLTTGSDAEVRQRLCAIAHAAHWRNVFLFAAGRCFQERQYLRDTIHTLCCDLNEGTNVPHSGALERVTLAGSRLALEVLEDGAIARQPGQLRLYARLALRLMELPPCDEQPRLALQCRPELEGLFQEELTRHLEARAPERHLGAWRVLLQLMDAGHPWAIALAERYWPAEADSTASLFETLPETSESSWLVERWIGAVPNLCPVAVRRLLADRAWPQWMRKSTPRWAGYLADPSRSSDQLKFRIAGIPEALTLTLNRVNVAKAPPGPVPAQARWQWQLAAEVRAFASDPTSARLAAVLRHFAEYWDQIKAAGCSVPANGVPWPLWACLNTGGTVADLWQFAADLEASRLGDRADWEYAQERWSTKGVTAADLAHEWPVGLPFDRQIVEEGLPNVGIGYSVPVPTPVTAIDPLLRLWRQCAPGHSANIADLILFALENLSRRHSVGIGADPTDLLPVIQATHSRWTDMDLLRALSDAQWEDSRWLNVLDQLGEKAYRITYVPGVDAFANQRLGEHLEAMASGHPGRIGLLVLLAAACRYGYNPTGTGLRLDPKVYPEPRHRVAVLMIRLATGSWGEADAETLAAQIADLHEPSGEVIADTLATLSHIPNADQPKDALLTALYAGLQPGDWVARKAVMDGMQVEQRRRLSAPIA
jgi:hypothetical protein